MTINTRISNRVGGQRDPSLIFQAVAGYATDLYRDNVSATNFSQTYAGTNRTITTAAGLNAAVPANTVPIDYVNGVPAIRLEPAATYYFLNSAAPATQDCDVLAVKHTVCLVGTGSATISAGTATIAAGGAATDGTPFTVNVTGAGTITVTIAGSPTRVWLTNTAMAHSYVVTAGSTVTRTTEANTVTLAIPAAVTNRLIPLTPTAVTLANSRISAVDGTAFYDAGVASVLTDNIGKLLTVKDSAGRIIKGWIKAAGSAETLDTSLFAGFNFTSGWTAAGGATIVDADTFTTVAGGGPYTDADVFVSKALYKSQIVSNPAVDCILKDNNSEVSFAPNSGAVQYRVAETFLKAYVVAGASLTVNITTLSSQKVLTPSATGVTIVSTQGGATYNWMFKDASFNYNDASGYTYGISDADTAGTIVIKGRFAFARAAGVVTNIISSEAATASLIYTTTAAGNITSNDGTTIAENAGAYTANTDWKIALKFPSDTDEYMIGIDVDGAGIVWGTEVAFDGAFTATANLILGYVIHGATWIKWIKIYDKVLTDAQINAMN